MPDTSLHRLIYCSRSRLTGGEAALEAEIRQILGTSRRNNARAGVTGALLFNAGCFGQVLEGPLPAVQATFERIQRDERHGEVTLLDFGPAERRGFAAWSMAFVGRSSRHRDLFGDIAGTSGFDPGRLSGERLLALLTDFVLQEEPTSPAA